MRSIVLCAVLAVVAGCLNHATPRDKAIEHTLPLPGTAAAPPTVAGLPAELHVVTFNLHGESGPAVIAGLRADPALRGADLLVLEEVHRIGDGCSTACVIARELGFHAVYAPGHVANNGTDGVAIVARAPILAARVIELPQFFVIENGGRRIAMAATLQIDGQPLTVYAVHLENRVTVAQRARQLAPVLADGASAPGRVIIAGDFNTSPFTWLGHLLPIPTGTQDDHLEALVRAHGFATPVIASGPTHHHLWMKLDAIYTRGFTTWEFATARALDVSDHLALWAKMFPLT